MDLDVAERRRSGNTAKQLLQGKQVLKELALRGHKVN
jgi:hypothetical protein